MAKPGISELRHQGRIDEAMALFLSSVDNVDVQRTIQVHLFGERDLVTEWAGFMFRDGRRAECVSGLDELGAKVQPKLGALQQPFRDRLALIKSLAGDGGTASDPGSLQTAIAEFIESVNGTNGWNYKKFAPIDELEQPAKSPAESLAQSLAVDASNLGNGPAFLNRLPNDELRQLFFDLAGKPINGSAGISGWTNPGLLMAGELIAYLETKSAQEDDHSNALGLKPVHTWIMFAVDAHKPDGVLARLTIEPVPRSSSGIGKGLLVPDPLSGSYLRMQSSFSSALQRAWFAIWKFRLNGLFSGFDFRWRIELGEALEGTVLQNFVPYPPLTGHSGEGAIACAMLACANGETLDRNTSMSAMLANEVDQRLELQVVDGLDCKTLSVRLTKKKILDVLVSSKQSDVSLDFGTNQKPRKVADFDSAFRQFTQYGRITRLVKQGIARRAETQIIEFCGAEIPAEQHDELGSNYVPSPIAERYPREELDENGRLKEPRPLDADERADFMVGKWRTKHVNANDPVRMALFATSGMGKTIQLTAMERAMALDDSPVVPIRIGKASGIKSPTTKIKNQLGLITLADVGWTGEKDSVLKQIWQQHFARLVRDETGKELISEVAGIAWLQRAAQVGDLWFLLDALDQSTMKLEGLRSFLITVPNCPALAAGRRESLATRAELFENQTWLTLELCGFGRDEQLGFLGQQLFDALIPQSESLWMRSDDDERRRHVWKDLVGVPMLLKMLKELAFERPSNIRNRHDLYEKTIDRLLRKGVNTFANPGEIKLRIDDFKNDFAEIAGKIVRRHQFDVIEGEDFKRIRSELGENRIEELIQTAMICEFEIIERMELADHENTIGSIRAGIDWRHRSFLEFFAARQLAREWEQDRESVISLLRDIHECLNEQGEFREWTVCDPENGSITQKFRNLPADWHWTLRFLLAQLDAESRSELAMNLIRLGNPWVVFHSIFEDWLGFSPEVAWLTEELVRRNRLLEFDYFESEGEQGNTPQANAQVDFTQEFITDFLSPSTRDAGTLFGYQTLVGSNILWPEKSVRDVVKSRKNHLDDFLNPDRWYRIPDSKYLIADFPVTNAVFEAFCPSHRRMRNQYSNSDDQPAIYVSHYMAQMFCQWLSTLTGRRFELPNENLWEKAARWGRPTEWDYWWHPSEIWDEVCWYSRTSNGRSRGRTEALETLLALDRTKRTTTRDYRHPSYLSHQRIGLIDMLGNVWEWSSNAYASNREHDLGSARVVRGGSWQGSAILIFCRCSSRYFLGPGNRDNGAGFRLVVFE